MKNKLRCILIMGTLFLLILMNIFPSSAAAEDEETYDDWRSAYRSFISSGEYEKYLRVENPEYAELFSERLREWDSFSIYDLDLDGDRKSVV